MYIVLKPDWKSCSVCCTKNPGLEAPAQQKTVSGIRPTASDEEDDDVSRDDPMALLAPSKVLTSATVYAILCDDDDADFFLLR